MRRAYLAWRAFEERFLQYAAAILLLGPTLLAIVEVVRRYGFGVSFPWRQDAVTYGILAAIFLFFGITQSRGLHLRVTLLPSLLRAKGGRTGRAAAEVVEAAVAAVGLLFCAFVAWHGVPVALRMIETGRMTQSQIIPLWPFFIVFLVGMGFMAVSFFFRLYAQIQSMRGADLGSPYVEGTDGNGSIL